MKVGAGTGSYPPALENNQHQIQENCRRKVPYRARGFMGGSPSAMRRALVSVGAADTAVKAMAHNASTDKNFIVVPGGTYQNKGNWETLNFVWCRTTALLSLKNI